VIATAEATALRVRAHLSSLAPARASLAAALRRGGWEGEDGGRVLLVASEALSNAIEHGSLPGAPVEVAIEVGPDRVDLRVHDDGRPGAAGWTPPGPPAPESLRGRGLLIMAALADELDVRPAGRGTELRLSVGRAPAAVPA
jgi:serine/threonine-protein kinase RsbW